MAFRPEGFNTLTETGTPDSTAGSYRAFHAYATNDDGPTVETANYFDSLLLQPGRVKVGDVIMASLDIDGTPIVRHYVVNSITIHVVIAHGSAGAGTGLAPMTLFTNLADITAADLFTFTPGYAFRLEAFGFVVNKPATTGAKLATVTPKISGVAVTGGVLALTSADCTPQAAAVAASAITGLNVGSATDTITLTGSAVTAFIEGNGNFLLRLRNLDG